MSAEHPEPKSILASEHAVEIAERIWWVGHYVPQDRLQCHIYLIEHGDQSVLIDPGAYLTFNDTLRKIDEVTQFFNIRYFICHHQDPDITGALPLISRLISRDDAALVTHWRAAELLKHLQVDIPYWLVDKNDWRLDLGGRSLQFVFTPYLHFPGAFCSFDSATGTLFSSDLFGGFTEGRELIAQSESDFDGVRTFHEHYMPSRDILLHSMLRIEDLPLRQIAPQHGRIVTGDLVSFYISRLKELDCGLYLLGERHTDLEHLLVLNHMLRDVLNTLMVERDFRGIARRLLHHVRELFPVEAIDFIIPSGAGRVLRLAARNRFRGEEEDASPPMLEILQMDRDSWELAHPGQVCAHLASESTTCEEAALCLAVPLFSAIDGGILGLALFRRADDSELSEETGKVLGQIAGPLAVAIERETILRNLEGERDKIYERSIRDPLTGLYTRRYLDDVASRLISLHGRDRDSTFALLVLDLDHFKNVNDTHGHQVGDTVLKETGAAILAIVRPADIPVRFGGEEFVLLLPSSGIEEAHQCAERLRVELAATEFESESGPFRITMSAGVAVHRPAEELAALIRRADTALYEAKELGRNRVVVAD